MFHDVFYILIFGWIFMAFGYLTVRLLIAWLQMLRWQKGKAILEQLVIAPEASKYVSMDARIEAVYTYEYQGVRYHGTCISVFDSVPYLNFFGYGPLALSKLNELFIDKRAIRIKINPRYPERSVLIDMPVGGPLSLGTTLTLVSLGFLIYFCLEGATPLSTAIGLGSAFILFLLGMASRNAFMFIFMVFGSL